MNSDLELLQKITKEATEEENELHSLLNILIQRVGGISTITPEGKYIQVNSKYASICGYRPKDLVGKQWTDTVFPEDIPLALECYEEMLKNGESTLRAFRGLNKQGETFLKTITLIKRVSISHEHIGHYCFMNED